VTERRAAYTTPQQQMRKAERERHELTLIDQIHRAGLPEPKRQYKFHPKRRWACDLAYPEQGIVIEVEGGIWSGGRHVRGAGYEADCEKYNEAEIMGLMVLRFTPGMIASGYAVEAIRRALAVV